MSDEQPRAEWIFPEEKKKGSKRRVWLIVGLVIAALVIIAVVWFLVIPRDETAGPDVSASPSSTTPSSTPPAASLPPTESAAPEPDPSMTPITTPPPLPDPDLDTFVGQVQPWLDDATTGLKMVADMTGAEAAQVVDSLQGDAGRLSDAVAPTSISSKWYDAASEYSTRLVDLQNAISDGGSTRALIDDASDALRELRTIVRL